MQQVTGISLRKLGRRLELIVSIGLVIRLYRLSVYLRIAVLGSALASTNLLCYDLVLSGLAAATCRRWV
jgi:hypothetical protein